MKKIIALSFAIVLALTLSLTAFAGDYTVGGDGNAVYDTAIGYVFDIEDVNGTINGEDATVLNSADGLANCGKWAIWLVAEQIEDTDYYKAITDGAAMGGETPSVSLKDNQIIVVVHSSTSNPDQADLYPNWEDKVAALAIKKGDCLVFDGINVKTGAGTNGTMTVVTMDDILAGLVPETSVPTEEESSEEVVESEVESSEVVESEASSEAESVAASSEASSEESDVSLNSSEMKTGLSTTTIILLVAAVAVVAAVVVIIVKKK